MAVDTVGRFSASLIDSSGIRSTALAHFLTDPARSVSAIATEYAAWLAALDKTTDMKIVGGDVGLSLALPTRGTDPGQIKNTAGGEADDCGVLDFNQSGVPFHYGFTIPGIAAAVQSGGHITTGSGPVSDLIDILTGVFATDAFFVGNSTDQLVSLYRSFLPDRKHRRQSFGKSVKYE